MAKRVLVTAALPYANGSIHIGHLVEYTQADIYVRALKRQGKDAIYICANDAHGTPIELNAQKQNKRPEDLVARFHEEHQRDFARFDVAFDHFGLTHSEANRAIVEDAYAKLRGAALLEDREIEGNWCENDQRFLPDRFIKGTCPRCGAIDQYGDVCEACGATYAPTDLKDPHCALCQTPPMRKKSKHVFFKLSNKEQVAFLSRWIESGVMQDDVANYVRRWIETGLRDWDISRDGPYFGFAIPDKKDSYFYVWLDAPFGYVASAKEWGDRNGVSLEELWRSEDTRIEHIIGKDIVYFHTLFWPAVLNATGYTLPSRIRVHGMLTVNGEKMSKSRGTFINAATFAEHVEPQALRFYYASKLGSHTDDIDLSLDDFVHKINGELVNKHANLFSRTCQFLENKLDGNLGDLPFTPEQAQEEGQEDGSLLALARRVVAGCRRMEQAYEAMELSQVVREAALCADIGNELMQSAQPWVQIKNDPEAARRTCTFAANVCHALAVYLWPIVPRFAEAGARMLGSDIESMNAATLFCERNRPIGELERLFERIDRKTLEQVIQKSTVGGERKDANAKTAATESKKSRSGDGTRDEQMITFDQFQTLDLRVGEIVSAEPVPKSKKLLRLAVDLGEATPRQIVAGIAHVYAPGELLGTRVVVVANLAPAKLMGVESRGMVLAAGRGDELAVVRPERDLPPGTRVS